MDVRGRPANLAPRLYAVYAGRCFCFRHAALPSCGGTGLHGYDQPQDEQGQDKRRGRCYQRDEQGATPAHPR